MNRLVAFGHVTTSQKKCSTPLNQRFNSVVRLLYSISKKYSLTESNKEGDNDSFKIYDREKINNLSKA